jgi:phage tail sheath protein FI
MPVHPTYPGVYIEELPSGVRTITGVPTSITAFVGRARRGEINDPVRIQNFGDFERQFGGLWEESTLSYALQQFFQNGGSDALIVRVVHPNAAASTFPAILGQGGGNFDLETTNPGGWGDSLRARVDHNTRPYEPGETADTLFNLSVKDMQTNTTEVHRNLSVEPNHRRFVTRVLEEESYLVRVVAASPVPGLRPVPHNNLPSLGADPFALGAGFFTQATAGSGADGSAINDADLLGIPANRTGVYALEDADLFNLLCLPPLTRDTDVSTATYSSVVTYCEQRRALLIVDPPDWVDVQAATTNLNAFTSAVSRHRNAAFYFPRVRIPDPLKDNRVEDFVPCGVVAGVMARTDVERGVWKAPAGRDATLFGVRELTVKMTDGENGLLNTLGVNCLRNFAIAGNVVWGARTLRGADELADQWKYIPVRRLALYIEESLYRGTQWVVFEPNDEPLWAQIRLNVGAFMQDLFRKGAFQGATPREAYLVKCDKETTTQNDIDHGIVNIVVGFAPLKPAEFVIIKIQQLAGNIQT